MQNEIYIYSGWMRQNSKFTLVLGVGTSVEQARVRCTENMRLRAKGQPFEAFHDPNSVPQLNTDAQLLVEISDEYKQAQETSNVNLCGVVRRIDADL